MQTKIARLICRPHGHCYSLSWAHKVGLWFKKKRNNLLADNKLLYCFFSPTNAHEGVGWGSVAQLAACCWFDDCRIQGTHLLPPIFFLIILLIVFFSHSLQAQVEVAMNVGAYHYDTLFDYYDELSDPKARKRVRFYYYYFQYAISPMLKFRNYRRFRKGHLTYPYLQYPWLPNGIQT